MNVWEVIEANLAIPGNFIGLYGPPGTGKTFAAARYGLPEDGVVLQVGEHDSSDPGALPEDAFALFSLTLTDGSSEAEIRGHYIPTAEGGKWIDGPGTLAWKFSHHVLTRAVFNEVDRASDEVLSILYALADDPSSPGTMISLPNDARETIRPGKNFSLVVTMNGVPEDLPEALQDRFSWINVNEINPKALASLSEPLRAPAAAAALATGSRRISIRKWLAFDRLQQNGMERQMAGYTAFGADAYQSVLDSIAVAKAATRVAQFQMDYSLLQNRNFAKDFSSYEAFQPGQVGEEHNWYCGWCQEWRHDCSCEGKCGAMRFTSDEEFQDFAVHIGLPIEDEDTEWDELWKWSMTYRTFTRPITFDEASDLCSLI